MLSISASDLVGNYPDLYFDYNQYYCVGHNFYFRTKRGSDGYEPTLPNFEPGSNSFDYYKNWQASEGLNIDQHSEYRLMGHPTGATDSYWEW